MEAGYEVLKSGLILCMDMDIFYGYKVFPTIHRL